MNLRMNLLKQLSIIEVTESQKESSYENVGEISLLRNNACTIRPEGYQKKKKEETQKKKKLRQILI